MSKAIAPDMHLAQAGAADAADLYTRVEQTMRRYVEATWGAWREAETRDTLTKAVAEGRTHHVHIRVPPDAEPELAFRDLLRANPPLARRYAMLKHDLAARYPHNREAYTDGKTEFVAEVLARNRV